MISKITCNMRANASKKNAICEQIKKCKKIQEIFILTTSTNTIQKYDEIIYLFQINWGYYFLKKEKDNNK